MSELREYKCPCCDGGIEFDSRLQKMKCPYCGTEFEPETLISYAEELKKDSGDDMSFGEIPGKEWEDGEEGNLDVYVCNTCGGEVVTDNTTAASFCPYCANPIIMKGKLSGMLKPDYVIPFKIDKKQAVNILKNHYNGKRLLPKVFKDKNHIEEIKGIYVPFWLFDADANAHIRYRATRVSTWSDSNYYYTRTSFYSVTRGGKIGFERVPVDGSSKMDDTLMESLEPFDFSQAVDFSTAYLSGFFADKYDVDAAQSIQRANERIKRTTEETFRDTVTGFMTVTPQSSNIRFDNSRSNYALYPVWILNTEWNGQKYTFAINGQTGKIAGDLPVDKGAFTRWFASVFAGVSAAAFGISYLLWLM